MACKDTLAQQYLLDCVVQVFSDECHLQTLDLLLAETANVQKGGAFRATSECRSACLFSSRAVHCDVAFDCSKLQLWRFFSVALKPVLVNLLNRLTSFLQADPEVRIHSSVKEVSWISSCPFLLELGITDVLPTCFPFGAYC